VSGAGPSMSPVEMTDAQRRTLEQLVGTGERPLFPQDLSRRLRDRIEGALRGLDLSGQLWLGKSALNDHDRCRGLFHAGVEGEAEPFAHSRKTATGRLFHKAIELDVAGREDRDVYELARTSVERLEDDGSFHDFWSELDVIEQDEIVMEGAKALDLFRATFPPLRALRRQLAPIPELPVRVELLGETLVLSGRVDLALGPLQPPRGTRLLLDMKSQGAWPEYPQDMRFYGLAHTLRFGVPPYRVATFFLESGSWQAEDVTEEIHDKAADRVVAAARSAGALAAGRTPDLSPGAWCGWCPRRTACPASAAPETS